MILEAVLTTVGVNGVVNVAPMGPHVTPDLSRFALKPFVGSRTHANLFETDRATIHVTDDCLLIARAVTGTLDPLPEMRPIREGRWQVMVDACRYFAVEVDDWQADALRPTAHCRVIESGHLRPFFGFNRAKHAVLEAAILATRTHLIPRDESEAELRRLEPLVQKTAGPAEEEAFELLKQYITERRE